MEFFFGNLSYEEVLRFLFETNNEFIRPLSLKVDLCEYARKLASYASFSYCVDNGEIIGMISCYTNQPPIGYISNVCVKSRFQGKGVFQKMFEKLKRECVNFGISKIKLEVDEDNDVAILVYRKNGFSMIREGNVHSMFMECVL